MNLLGIRREDKNHFERRVPLVPEHVASLRHEHHVQIALQPSARRIFTDEEYLAAGASIVEGLEACPIILGIKEIPPAKLLSCKTYLFFSHTIKGQEQNMPLLRRLLELGCTLIDYEKITDETGRRLVFFGRHAGLAGMIDALWALGQRLAASGQPSPLERLRQAHAYSSLAEAKAAMKEAGDALRCSTTKLPSSLMPLTIGLTGYGNVSAGAQEIADLLQPQQIAPQELEGIRDGAAGVFKVVFREEHMVEPLEGPFVLQDYYQRPQGYRPSFARYLDRLSLLVNCIYWEPRYPRLVTVDDLRQLYSGAATPRLQVIADLSCDVGGAIEATVKVTDPERPLYTFDPEEQTERDGVEGRGPAILAVDNLPAELPREASEFFSSALLPLVPSLTAADFSGPFTDCRLPGPLQRAVVVYRGQLTPAYDYLRRYL